MCIEALTFRGAGRSNLRWGTYTDTGAGGKMPLGRGTPREGNRTSQQRSPGRSEAWCTGAAGIFKKRNNSSEQSWQSRISPDSTSSSGNGSANSSYPPNWRGCRRRPQRGVRSSMLVAGTGSVQWVQINVMGATSPPTVSRREREAQAVAYVVHSCAGTIKPCPPRPTT